MIWWVTLLWYIGAFLVTELLRPKPDIENARPAGLGDFNVPTAIEGRVGHLPTLTLPLSKLCPGTVLIARASKNAFP